MPDEMRFMLSGEDFENLVGGGIVEKAGLSGEKVKIALSDIGWVEMMRLLQQAMRKAETKKLDRR